MKILKKIIPPGIIFVLILTNGIQLARLWESKKQEEIQVDVQKEKEGEREEKVRALLAMHIESFPSQDYFGVRTAQAEHANSFLITLEYLTQSIEDYRGAALLASAGGKVEGKYQGVLDLLEEYREQLVVHRDNLCRNIRWYKTDWVETILGNLRVIRQWLSERREEGLYSLEELERAVSLEPTKDLIKREPKKELTGKGTSESPYQIWTEQDLHQFAENAKAACYKLMEDIDVSGEIKSFHFSGVLDGNGHRIRGLKEPLFRYLEGEVKNLELQIEIRYFASYIEGDFGTGGLTKGLSEKGYIHDCKIEGTMDIYALKEDINETVRRGDTGPIGKIAGEGRGRMENNKVDIEIRVKTDW